MGDDRLSGRQLWETFNRIITAGLTLVLGLVSYQGKTVLDTIADHDRRISIIESNRYTPADALEDNRRLASEIAAMRQWVEGNFPPEWLREDVQEIKADIRELKTRTWLGLENPSN